MPCLASTLIRQQAYSRVASHFTELADKERNREYKARLHSIAKKYTRKVVKLEARGKELRKKHIFFNQRNGQIHPV